MENTRLLEDAKTLKLTVHKEAFEVMVTGEKNREFRKPSKWIKSRLWKKEKSIIIPREYEFIEIRNGYGKTRPSFTAEFIGFVITTRPFYANYTNGLNVKINNEDLILNIGNIINVENYKL